MKKGFTLLEVMVVIIIIAVMAAIAVPSLLKKFRMDQVTAAGLTTAKTLDRAAALVKKTGFPYSVEMETGKRQMRIWRGPDCSGTQTTAKDSSNTAVVIDSLSGKVVDSVTISDKVVFDKSVGLNVAVGNTNTTLVAAQAISGSWVVNSKQCVTLKPGKVGNPVDSAGWVTLQYPGYTTAIGVVVLKDKKDDRFQTWLYNSGSWTRK